MDDNKLNNDDASGTVSDTSSNNKYNLPDSDQKPNFFKHDNGVSGGVDASMPNGNANFNSSLNSSLPGAGKNLNGGTPGSGTSMPDGQESDLGNQGRNGSRDNDSSKSLGTGKNNKNGDGNPDSSNDDSSDKPKNEESKTAADDGRKNESSAGGKSLGSKVAGGIGNTAKKFGRGIGNKAKNTASNLGKEDADGDDLNRKSDEDVKNGAKNVANTAGKALKTGANLVMKLPIPMVVKVLILVFLPVLLLLCIIILVVAVGEISSVDYGSKHMCDINVKLSASDTYVNIQDYVNGVVYKNYKDENDNFIKAFTILLVSNIYNDYNGHSDFDTSIYDYYTFDYSDVSIPSACSFIFCNNYGDEEQIDDNDSAESDLEKNGLTKKMNDCITSLKEKGHDFVENSIYGEKKVINNEETFVYKKEIEDTLAMDIKNEFSVRNIVDPLINHYVKDPVEITSSVIDKMMNDANEGLDYNDILKNVHEKDNLVVQEYSQCSFKVGNCGNISGSVCNSTGGLFMYPLPTVVPCKTYSEHNACDFVVPVGTPVYVVADATVMELFHNNRNCYGICTNGNASYGIGVKVLYVNGITGVYGHLSEISSDISVGQHITAGTQIGLSGNTGNSSGAHLHFDFYEYGDRIVDSNFTAALIGAPPGSGVRSVSYNNSPFFDLFSQISVTCSDDSSDDTGSVSNSTSSGISNSIASKYNYSQDCSVNDAGSNERDKCKWGNMTFGNGKSYEDGCGVTALAMASSSLNNSYILPNDVGDVVGDSYISVSGGLYSNDKVDAFLNTKNLNKSIYKMSTQIDDIANKISSGQCVAIYHAIGGKAFTNVGHYNTLTRVRKGINGYEFLMYDSGETEYVPNAASIDNYVSVDNEGDSQPNTNTDHWKRDRNVYWSEQFLKLNGDDNIMLICK